MFVKPTAGRRVPDPARGDTLPPEGRKVDPSQYWQRRLNDGDVVESSPPTTSTPPAAPAATSSKTTKGKQE